MRYLNFLYIDTLIFVSIYDDLSQIFYAYHIQNKDNFKTLISRWIIAKHLESFIVQIVLRHRIARLGLRPTIAVLNNLVEG